MDQLFNPDPPCPHGCELGWVFDPAGVASPCPIHGTPKPRKAARQAAEDVTYSGMLSPLLSWRGAVCSGGSGLTPAQRLIALVVSLHMNERGGSAFPSLKRLERESGYDRRHVIRLLQGLVKAGWLTATKRERQPTFYQAQIPPTWRSDEDET